MIATGIPRVRLKCSNIRSRPRQLIAYSPTGCGRVGLARAAAAGRRQAVDVAGREGDDAARGEPSADHAGQVAFIAHVSGSWPVEPNFIRPCRRRSARRAVAPARARRAGRQRDRLDAVPLERAPARAGVREARHADDAARTPAALGRAPRHPRERRPHLAGHAEDERRRRRLAHGASTAAVCGSLSSSSSSSTSPMTVGSAIAPYYGCGSRVPLPHRLSLRPMTAADVPAGLALCRASRWNQVERDWHRFLAASPDGAAVAERHGRIVGTVATLPYESRFTWISMVLVDPGRAGPGDRHAAARARACHSWSPGCAARLDATPAGEAIYRPLGFVEEFALTRWRLDQRASSLAGHPLARPLEPRDWPAILALDAPAFGVSRADHLAWLADGAPHYAWVLDGQGTIGACLFGRHGHDRDQLGPLIARDRRSAEARARHLPRGHIPGGSSTWTRLMRSPAGGTGSRRSGSPRSARFCGCIAGNWRRREGRKRSSPSPGRSSGDQGLEAGGTG